MINIDYDYIHRTIKNTYKEVFDIVKDININQEIEKIILKYSGKEEINPTLYTVFHLKNKINFKLCQEYRKDNLDVLMFFRSTYYQIGLYIAKKISKDEGSYENFYDEALLKTLEYYDGSELFGLSLIRYSKHDQEKETQVQNFVELQPHKEDKQVKEIISLDEFFQLKNIIPEDRIVLLLENQPFLHNLIFYLYQGYIGKRTYTIEEISKCLNINQEQVRHILIEQFVAYKKQLNEYLNVEISLYYSKSGKENIKTCSKNYLNK